MLAYWILAGLAELKIIHVPAEWMYSDYKNPLIVAWNWSFFPLDVLFAITGLTARFSGIAKGKKEMLSIISLSLMFCAGLMAISFWVIQQSFDPWWWGANIWLMGLSLFALKQKFAAKP